MTEYETPKNTNWYDELYIPEEGEYVEPNTTNRKNIQHITINN